MKIPGLTECATSWTLIALALLRQYPSASPHPNPDNITTTVGTHHSGACSSNTVVPHVSVQSVSRQPGIRDSSTACFFRHDQLSGSSGLVDGRGTSSVPSTAVLRAGEPEALRRKAAAPWSCSFSPAASISLAARAGELAVSTGDVGFMPAIVLGAVLLVLSLGNSDLDDLDDDDVSLDARVPAILYHVRATASRLLLTCLPACDL